MRKLFLSYIYCVYGWIHYLYAKYIWAKRRQWKSNQKKELYNLLNYCKKHVFKYANIPNVSIDNCMNILETLPLLEKNDLIGSPELYYSSDITDSWPKWFNTGGSTVEPLRFPFKSNKMLLNLDFLHQMMLYVQMGYSFGDVIISIDGVKIPEEKIAKNIFWETRDNFIYGKYRLSTLCLEENNCKYYIDFIRKKRPAILRGYPSGIAMLAKYIKNNTDCSFGYKLKGIYLTSENIDSSDRETIREIFKCDVWGQYGHTESSIFGVMPPGTSTYYCSPLYGVTEVIDKEGQQVNIGEIGEICVTGFSNVGCPFIRYKTGDMAIYGGCDDNGSVLLTKLLGRDSDKLYNSLGGAVFLVGFIFGGHLKAFDHIRQWQLIQNEKGKVEAVIVRGNGYNSAMEQEITNLFNKEELDVVFSYVDKIEKTKRGKQRFLIQNLN